MTRTGATGGRRLGRMEHPVDHAARVTLVVTIAFLALLTAAFLLHMPIQTRLAPEGGIFPQWYSERGTPPPGWDCSRQGLCDPLPSR